MVTIVPLSSVRGRAADRLVISKIEGSPQELEEGEYWLELRAESGFYPEEKLIALKKESGGGGSQEKGGG